MFIHSVAIGIFLAATCPLALSAQDQETPQNLIGWLKYQGVHPLRKHAHWSVRVDAETKRNHIVTEPVSSKGRLGFEWRGRVRLALGYYFAWHSPYDAASRPYSFPEQGAWEEVTFGHHLGSGRKVELNHRWRLEQQWTARRDSAGAPIDHWEFENRFAYRAQLAFGDGFAPVISNEIWLRAPPGSGEKFLDENRAQAGVRIPLGSSDWRLDLAYMHQAVFRSALNTTGRQRVNHNIRLTLNSSAPIR